MQSAKELPHHRCPDVRTMSEYTSYGTASSNQKQPRSPLIGAFSWHLGRSISLLAKSWWEKWRRFRSKVVLYSSRSEQAMESSCSRLPGTFTRVSILVYVWRLIFLSKKGVSARQHLLYKTLVRTPCLTCSLLVIDSLAR
jgi:hypothetical protein